MNLQKIKQILNQIEKRNSSRISFTLNSKELMKLEKQRLGFNQNDLVFVSAGDFSKFYWCPMQTYFSLKQNETKKFEGYLLDKIQYSFELGDLKKLPQTKNELLSIGDKIKLKDIYQLLKQKKYSNIKTQEQIIDAKKQLKQCTLQTEKGHYLETIYAQTFSQIHWFVKYKNFIFTCEPDGISEEFVYEFKSSKNTYFSKQSMQKAKLQTDIYAVCFNQKNKRIDQLITSTNKIQKIEESLNIKRLDFVIEQINNIIKGVLPSPPYQKFKCNNCEYKNECTIKI